MNSLLLYPEELVSAERAVLAGERADCAVAEHDLKEGLRIAASVLNGKRGWVEILSIRGGRMELACSFDKPPPERLALEVIAAVPRPQTVKKVIQLAAASGMRAVHFVRSRNTQPSYLQSKTLTAREIRRHTELGLEQAFDCVPPQINIFMSLDACFSERAADYAGDRVLKILAHAGSAHETREFGGMERLRGGRPAVAAIGPESGWTGDEIEKFLALGFETVSLGERMFRVEQALALIAGQVMLLNGGRDDVRGKVSGMKS